MSGRFDDPADLPGGRSRIRWRRNPAAAPLAALIGALWPPLVVTMIFWPAHNWRPAIDMDWRLIMLAIGLVATPVGVWLLSREHDRTGRPGTRLGVVWRFMLYGGLLAAFLQTVFALGAAVLSWIEADGLLQGMGASETTLLIYGVGGLPLAIVVGASYALWAGLCVCFIAFEPAPSAVRDRLGLMAGTGRGAGVA